MNYSWWQKQTSRCQELPYDLVRRLNKDMPVTRGEGEPARAPRQRGEEKQMELDEGKEDSPELEPRRSSRARRAPRRDEAEGQYDYRPSPERGSRRRR
jgi:hypothetical protein